MVNTCAALRGLGNITQNGSALNDLKVSTRHWEMSHPMFRAPALIHTSEV